MHDVEFTSNKLNTGFLFKCRLRRETLCTVTLSCCVGGQRCDEVLPAMGTLRVRILKICTPRERQFKGG